MHKVCAIQLPWKPFTVLSADGVVTADPAQQLRHLAEELEPFWQTTMVSPSLETAGRGTLGSISVQEVVEASASFRHTTASNGLQP